MQICGYRDLKSGGFRSGAVFNQEAPNPIPSSCNQLLVMRVLIWVRGEGVGLMSLGAVVVDTCLNLISIKRVTDT